MAQRYCADAILSRKSYVFDFWTKDPAGLGPNLGTVEGMLPIQLKMKPKKRRKNRKEKKRKKERSLLELDWSGDWIQASYVRKPHLCQRGWYISASSVESSPFLCSPSSSPVLIPTLSRIKHTRPSVGISVQRMMRQPWRMKSDRSPPPVKIEFHCFIPRVLHTAHSWIVNHEDLSWIVFCEVVINLLGVWITGIESDPLLWSTSYECHLLIAL